MDNRALWSRILASIGLVFMLSGFMVPDLMFLGIGVVTIGALIIKSRRRKIIPLLGAGLVFVSAGVVPYIFISISVLTGKAENAKMIKYTQIIVLGFAIICTAIGAIGIITDRKHPGAPPGPGS
mgnify:CR=1 FL=1